MDIISGVIGSMLGKAAELLVDPIAVEIGYVFNSKENAAALKDKLAMLHEHREELGNRVDDALRAGEEVKPNVRRWIDRYGGIVRRVDDCEESTCQRCCIVSCPILGKRYLIGKKASKDATDIVKLLKDGQFDAVSTQIRRPWDFSVKNFEEFESRASVTDRILDALKTPDTQLIGLYGLTGVGKTTLVNEIAARTKNDRLFDVVSASVVTDAPVLSRIHAEIADAFEFKLEAVSDAGRSRELKAKLERGSTEHMQIKGSGEKRIIESFEKTIKFLVILDDVWDPIKLDEIGIPLKEGCKVLITSRNRDVLCKEMGVRTVFCIESLSEEESRLFFKKMVGDSFDDPNFNGLPLQVADRCGGLPVLLTSVASALRDADFDDWRDAVNQLKRFGNDSLDTIAYSALNLSYNKLRSEELKMLFLLCGQLWRRVIPLDYLIYYGMGLDLIEGCTTYEEFRIKFFRLIKDLKASCLLQDSSGKNLMTMHDVVHSFAKSYASKNRNILTIEGEEWPKIDVLENCLWLHISSETMPSLPSSIQFLKLQALLVFSSNFHLNEDFFDKMKELKVLDITGMNLSTLPSSFQYLLKLQTLCLDYCELSDVKVVGNLRALKVLSFAGSDITNLPIEIGQLINLKLLNIENCTKLEHIPPNLLSNLTNLEEILMDNSFSKWETDDCAITPINANIDEISFLRKLNSLRICIPNARALYSGNFPEKLERFKILIGACEDRDSDTNKMFQVVLDDSTQLPPSSMNLLKSAEYVSICASKVAKEFLKEVGHSGLQKLKYLHIKDSVEVVVIVDSLKQHQHPVFPNLNHLFLENLSLLEKICDGILPSRSCINLEILQLHNCDKLKVLFSASIASSLPKLRQLVLKNCENLEAIFAYNNPSDSNEVFQFHQLRSLELICLPNLSGSLFDKKIALPNLEILTLRQINAKNIWDQNLKEFDMSLGELLITQCDHLKYVMTDSVAKCLSQLKFVIIENCRILEEIVFSEGNISSEIIFPHLKGLLLTNLTKLIRFCNCKHAYFGSIERISIIACPKMVSFNGFSSAFFNEKVNMPNLNVLKIYGGDSIKTLCDNEIDPLANLELLVIAKCNSLKTLCRLSVIRNVGALSVLNCSSLEEVLDVDANDVIVSKLRDFTIENLPNLKEIFRSNCTGTVNLENLAVVEASNCRSLRSLFPASCGRNLQQLESLKIYDCESLEAIVESNETSTDVLCLPRLKSIKLRRLEKLESFCVGVHKLECPSLRDLRFFDCKLNVHSLFSLNEILPNLHSVSLTKDDTASFLQHDIPFENVSTLELQNFAGEQETFPTDLIQRFSGMDKLSLYHCGFEEVPNLNGRIINLKIFHLDFLKYVRLENLLHLRIFRCKRVENLNFLSQIVTKLTIVDCQSLRYLFTPEIVRGLQQLEILQVGGCNSISEIMRNEGNCDNVIFEKLERLILWNLESLRWFTDAESSLEFPSLNFLYIRNCPARIVFSKGRPTAPKLCISQVDFIVATNSHHDLNKIFQQYNAE